jgi:hypothetical protein
MPTIHPSWWLPAKPCTCTALGRKYETMLCQQERKKLLWMWHPMYVTFVLLPSLLFIPNLGRKYLSYQKRTEHNIFNALHLPKEEVPWSRRKIHPTTTRLSTSNRKWQTSKHYLRWLSPKLYGNSRDEGGGNLFGEYKVGKSRKVTTNAETVYLFSKRWQSTR